MRDKWDTELRDRVYNSESLDVAARSDVVTSIDGILGAYDENTNLLTKELEDAKAKLAESQTAVTRLVMENSKHVSKAAAVKPADEPPKPEENKPLDDAAMLAAALDEGDGN